jgi:hypothetical protein
LPLISFEEVQEKYNVNEYKMIIAVGYVQMNSVREKKYKERVWVLLNGLVLFPFKHSKHERTK